MYLLTTTPTNHTYREQQMVRMGGESWRAIKDLKAPFPDLKAGHVDHLLTCVYFSMLCLLLLYCCLLFIFLPIFVFLFF